MSGLESFKALSLGATICIALFAAAACTIHLRGGETPPQTQPGTVAQKADPMSDELERCSTVSYEQKDKLAECRRVWTEKRRRFLGQSHDAARGPARPNPEAQPPVSLKDQSRLPPGLFTTPIPGER